MLLSCASHKEVLVTALRTGGGEQRTVPPGIIRGATNALESSVGWGEYKPSAEELQNPACPQHLSLQFSNTEAGCANSVHNPVLAMPNKQKNLPEQAGTDTGLGTVSARFPEVPNGTGNNPAFVIHNFHPPGWPFAEMEMDGQFPTAFQLGKCC